MKKKLLITGVLVAALALGGYLLFKKNGETVRYRTDRVTRGDVSAAVTATGTVSAVTTVTVGTQVSGTIRQIFVDYNSLVRKGQLLAQIDPALP